MPPDLGAISQQQPLVVVLDRKHTSELQEPLAPTMQSSPMFTPIPSPTYPNELTAREVEVLRLVAVGLSDSAVAERLVISPRTVQGHVRSIFNKIHVNSRVAATRYAIEHRLV